MATIHEITEDWIGKVQPPTLAKLQSAIAEFDALAADAARYRYLVTHLADQRGASALHSEWDKIDAFLDAGQVPSKEMFDAAIDAAMKGE